MTQRSRRGRKQEAKGPDCAVAERSYRSFPREWRPDGDLRIEMPLTTRGVVAWAPGSKKAAPHDLRVLRLLVAPRCLTRLRFRWWSRPQRKPWKP